MSKKKIIVLILMIFGFLALRYFEVDKTLTVATIFDNRNELIDFTSKHHLGSILIYAITYAFLVGIGLPVAAVLSITAGLIFGIYEGVVIAVLSATLGSFFSFTASRYIFSDYIRKKHNTKIEKLEARILKNKVRYILGLRLLPGMPFFLVNILAGLTSVELYTFIWTTIVGIFPSTIVFIFAGNGLKTINDFSEFKTAKIIVPGVIIVIIVILTVIGRVLYNKNKVK